MVETLAGMCVLCGQLLSSHWAEAGSNTRDRIERVKFLNTVLAHWGLHLDDWGNRVYVLRNWKGVGKPVPDLGRLWVVAEQLNGGSLDPLEQSLIERLTARASTGAGS